ncbi:hypothetical protein [Aestuariibacter sp. A3R04]|uniref:hypothetical protein n=1 Tax=Aestuariibacter sp. A3R04 TaxID=2841571 RepID=UPI001C0A2D58|nr:hypothetical protein [Aestuariibacter sp. A3R04]MBU3021885.1 hypothetical protein [Aestuariibacter sp. A3R04]
MQHKPSSWDMPPKPRRHWFAWIHHKPCQLAIAVGIFFGASILVWRMWSVNHALPSLYVAEPAISLAQQSARFLSIPMAQNNTKEIERMADTIAKTDNVLSVIVYRVDGQKVYSSVASWNSVSYLNQHVAPAQTLMTPITTQNGNTLGMLQLNIDVQTRLAQLHPLLTIHMRLILLVVLLSIISGGFGELAIIRYRPSWPYVKRALKEAVYAGRRPNN